jgi:hypothetical protein
MQKQQGRGRKKEPMTHDRNIRIQSEEARLSEISGDDSERRLRSHVSKLVTSSPIKKGSGRSQEAAS